jgi:hypothetical protein
MFCIWTFEFSVLKKQSQTQPNHAAKFSKVLSKKENMQQGISRYMLTCLFQTQMALSLKNTELNGTTVKAQTNSHTYKLLQTKQVKLSLV